MAASGVLVRLRGLGWGWIEAQAGRFGLWLPLCAVAGDAWFFAWRSNPPLWLGPVVVVVGAAMAATRRLPLYAVGLALVLAGGGFSAAQVAAVRAPAFAALPSRAAEVGGRVASVEALPSGERWLLDQVSVDGRPIGRTLRLRVAGVAGVTGSRVAVRAMAAPPAAPAYPGGRDLQLDAYFSGLGGYGYALGAPRVTKAARPDRLTALRERIAARVMAVLPGANGAIGAALLTGFSAAIPEADRAAFRDAGLAHLLAIAGLHIGIVMGLVLGAARAGLLASARVALHWPVRQIAAIASLAAGFGYLLLTGLHVPLLRAFAMAALVVLGLLTGRRALSLRSWGVAAVAVVLIEPAEITGASFQLSFAAVLALIAGYEALRAPLLRLRGVPRAGRALHHLATLALTSLLAGAASLPFIAYHFGRIQLYFVVANLVAVPITALLIMPAGLIALLLMPWGLDRLALTPMGWGIVAVLRLAHAVAGWPAATVGVPAMPLAALLTIALGLAWLCLWRGRFRLGGVAIMLVGCGLAALHAAPDVLLSADGRLAAVRGREGWLVRTARGGDDYTAAQWSQWLDRPLRAGCATTCTLAVAGARLVTLGDADSGCADIAALVVQQGAAPFCPGVATLDRGDSWADGAWAVWLARGRMVSDRAVRGARPWVWLPPEQRRATIDLPFAPVQRLPPGWPDQSRRSR